MNPRVLLAARGLRPKKSLGQNFLMDTGTSARIARLAVDAPGDRVLEVGAGTGSLTAALLTAGADLTAFDLDDTLVDILRSRDDVSAARIEHGDALEFDYEGYGSAGAWRCAGNLPYNIATPLLIKLAQMERPPERIVAMIQKDVADRLLAKPGTAAYGSLTIALAVTMRVERAFNVSPGQFFPRPKVISSVVVFHRLAQPLIEPGDRQRFEQVVRGAFAYRRKTLANSLALALELPRERIATALLALDLDADIRGEALDLRTFAALTDALDR